MQERRHAEIRATVSQVLSDANSNEWGSLVKSFEKLIKQVEKHYATPERISTFVKRALKQIVGTVESAYADKEHRQSLSTTGSKALSALRQRIGKYVKVNELDLEATSDSDSATDEEFAAGNVALNAGLEPDKKDKNYLLYADKKDVTFEMIDEKLKDVTASRGKKSTDRQVVVKHLTYIATLAKCPAQEVEILLHIISAQFDMTGSMSSHMPVLTWRSCVANILRLLLLLQANKHIELVERGEPSVRPDKDELLSDSPVQLAGSLCAFTERLDDEYVKSLQNIDPHTKEYVSRLQDECFLLMLIREILGHYLQQDDRENRVKLSLRLLARLHCKNPTSYDAMRRFANDRVDHITATSLEADELPEDVQVSNMEAFFAKDLTETLITDVSAWFPQGVMFPADTLATTMRNLTEYVYASGDQRSKVRAILYDTFHKSTCGDFRGAREQLLMSHLQESIHYMDIDTQVLFNRCMAQIGLHAFQRGSFSTAKTCLAELLSSGKVRELLAQGFSPGRYSTERNFEQEKLERRRQVPFHTQINVELLESIYLVSSMLTDTHTMFNKNKQPRMLNRTYLRLIEMFDKQTFSGPPEGIKDTVMCAAKHLIDGDWHTASNYVTEMPCWTLLPGSEETRKSVLDLVVMELKREALRTYVFQRASQYESISIETLSSMFNMSTESVQASINTLLSAGLAGSCDAPTSSFAVHAIGPTDLQMAVTAYAESLTVLLDANERTLGNRIESESTIPLDDEDLHWRQRDSRSHRYDERDESKPKASRYKLMARGAKNATIGISRLSKGRKQEVRDKTTKTEFTSRSGGRFTRT